jgi:hypothetical protein
LLITLVLAAIRSQNDIALALASSGIAATLLPGGRSAHSALKLPLNMQFIETLHVQHFQTIWHGKSIAEMQDLRGNIRPFGNALILLAGYFMQTLPVIP